MTVYIATLLIIFLASFTQGFSGFGFALISIPLLSFVVGIKYAIPLGALCGLVINVVLAVKLQNHINFKELKKLLIGAVLGIPPGVFFLAKAGTGLIQIMLGTVVLLFVVFSSTNLFKPKEINSIYGYIFGLSSGLLGGAFNASGPPVLIYFYLKSWDKIKFKASVTGFFLVTSVVIVISHLISGLTTTDVLIDFSLHLPVVLLGIFIGDRYFNKVSAKQYNRIILGALSISGILLIFN